MRDLHAYARLLADADRLVDGVEDHRGLAADMGKVVAAPRGHRLGERDQFVGVGIGTGRVDEARREAERAGVHRLAEQPLHRSHVVGVGRPRLESHGGDAQGAVADEVRDVDGGADRAERVEVLRERLPAQVEAGADAAGPAPDDLALVGAQRRLRERAHPDDFGRHALADFRLSRRTTEVEEIGVGVHVDEPGRHRVSGRVDHAGRLAGQVPADGDDPIAFDGDVRRPGGRARPVDQ